MARAEIGDR